MIDISSAMADIEHSVYVIIGCTISFGGTSLSCSKNSMHVTVCTNKVWLTTNPFTITSKHTPFLTVLVISTLCDVISCFNVDWSAILLSYRQIKTNSLSWCSRFFYLLINIDSLDDYRNICVFHLKFSSFVLNDETSLLVIWLIDFSFRETLIIWVQLVTTLRHFANVATIWSSTEIDDSRLTITCFGSMLSKVDVDSRLNFNSEVKFVYFGNGWQNSSIY